MHTSARARSVNNARAAICGQVSVHVLTGHSWCGHRHTRLIHTSVTGRPAVGRSRIHGQGPPVMQLGDPPFDSGGTVTRSAVVSMGLLELAIVLGHRHHNEPRQAQHRRRSTTLSFHLGPPISVSLTPRIMGPQACYQAQAEDRVLQRLTTLRNEEPAKSLLIRRRTWPTTTQRVTEGPG